jgi:hypothetical protein
VSEINASTSMPFFSFAQTNRLLSQNRSARNVLRFLEELGEEHQVLELVRIQNKI